MRCGRGVVGSSIVVGVGWEEGHRSRGQLWARKGCMLTLLVTVLRNTLWKRNVNILYSEHHFKIPDSNKNGV